MESAAGTLATLAVAIIAMALFGALAAAFGVDTRPGFDGRPTDR